MPVRATQGDVGGIGKGIMPLGAQAGFRIAPLPIDTVLAEPSFGYRLDCLWVFHRR